MDRRIVLLLVAAWFLAAGIDIYLNGFEIVDQFFEAFQAEVIPFP